MNEKHSIRLISMGGVLSTLTVVFQSAPIFLPAIGMLLSPFSTLPVAIAALFNSYLGIAVLLASGFILSLISLQEGMILFFTTGLLGIILGAFLERKGILFTLIVSTFTLTLGILSLIELVSIPSFVELANALSSKIILLLILLLFSFIYSALWCMILKKCIKKFHFIFKKSL